MMGLGSFKTQAEAARFDLALPSKWLFSNYTHVLESGKIWLGYLNSIIITVPVTVISVFLGAIAGIVISRRNDRLSQGIYYYFIFGLTLTLQIASIFFLLQYCGGSEWQEERHHPHICKKIARLIQIKNKYE